MGLFFGASSVNAQSVDLDQVTITPISTRSSVYPRNGVRIPFLQFRVGANEDLVIENMTFQQTGLSSNDDIESVWVESRYGRSNIGNVSNDGEAILTFPNGYEMEEGAQHVMVLYANLDGRNGITIGFNLTGIETDAAHISAASVPVQPEVFEPVRTTTTSSSALTLRERILAQMSRTQSTESVSNSASTEATVITDRRERRYSGSYTPFRGSYRPYSSTTVE